jgi:hypothetical protein
VAWHGEMACRFWSDMNENSFNGGINKELGSFKIGGGYA